VQGKCNELDQDFLITENLMKRLSKNSYSFKLMGEVMLKGKKKDVKVYGVS